MIDALTEIMFARSLDQCSLWKEHGLSLPLSLNLSVDSFDQLDLPGRVNASKLKVS